MNTLAFLQYALSRASNPGMAAITPDQIRAMSQSQPGTELSATSLNRGLAFHDLNYPDNPLMHPQLPTGQGPLSYNLLNSAVGYMPNGIPHGPAPVGSIQDSQQGYTPDVATDIIPHGPVVAQAVQPGGVLSGILGPDSPVTALQKLFGAALKQALTGGKGKGGGSNPAVDAINQQMGLLQSRADKSRQQIQTRGANAVDDINQLYGHLNKYVQNSNRQTQKGFKGEIAAVGSETSKQINKVNEIYSRHAKLGLDGVTPGLSADRKHAIVRILADGADTKNIARSEKSSFGALGRQMRADAKLEGSVQVTQAKRDTQRALDALANTLQQQLGQLKIQAGQAAAAGQASSPNSLDTVAKAVAIQKQLVDLKAATQKLNNPSATTTGSAAHGFQAALDYLASAGGQYATTEQALLTRAQQEGSVSSTAGNANLATQYQFKGTDGKTYEKYFDPNNITGILELMKTYMGTTGGNGGLGPATPNEILQLQRALRIAFGKD